MQRTPIDPDTIPEAKLKEYQIVFTNADKSGDGAIQRDELGKCLQALGLYPSEGKLKKILAEYDKDDTGDINFSEFLQLIHAVDEDLKRWRTVFRQFDKDGSGAITEDELKQALPELKQNWNLSEDQIERAMKNADKSGDGQIDYTEFLNYVSSFGEKGMGGL